MTTTTNPQGLPLNQYLAVQVAQPTLPGGAEFTPQTLPTDTATLQATGQLMDPTLANTGIDPMGVPITPQTVTTPMVTANTGTAQTVNQNVPLQYINPVTGQYDPALVGNNVVQGTAEQGVVNPLSTVQGQLANLYSQTQNGQTPEWAQGAVRAAENMLAARGLGASSIGAMAITEAVQQSALPIAAQDASTYFQMDLTNLSNRQQMAFTNLQTRQQSLLSDQAAANAANQFNAASDAQVQQFMATLVSNIQTQNADRLQAMSIFNTGQENQIDLTNAANQINTAQFNAQQWAAVEQFNAQQIFAREQFNAQAAFAIEQSNVLWRRNINTENTAAINAANQTNVQNRFNLSQTAQNQLWQQWRDEASWAFQASENERNRQFNLAVAANNGAIASQANTNSWASSAGSFVSSLLLG